MAGAAIPHPDRIERAARDAFAWRADAGRSMAGVGKLLAIVLSLALWAALIGIPMLLWGW
jgi:hypothetical protein